MLAFPPVGGRAWDFDDNGMTDAISTLLEAGGAKIYCIDGRDSGDVGSRAAYDAWVVDRVLPFVYADCGGPLEVLTAGCADGAVTAVDLVLRRADLFPVAVAMSGRYDDEAVDAVARLGHDHVDWLDGRLTVVLGIADDEDAAAAEAFAGRLGDLGIRHELQRTPVGTPPGWPAWRHLAATQLPRFC